MDTEEKIEKNNSANALHKIIKMPSEWGIRKISTLQLHLEQVLILGMPSSRGIITLDINPLGPTGCSMSLHCIQNFGSSKMPPCQLFGMTCIFPTA
jgi:hypothetical protein